MLDIDELKKQRLNEECEALFDAVRYITIKGEAHIGELRREVASAHRIPLYRLRALLNEAAIKGELGSEVRKPPHCKDPRARMQRRYYWIKKR